jgi:hypothetical protein
VVAHFNKYRTDYLFIVLIIIVSLLTVLFKIGEVPPAAYPWSDESDIASDAVLSYRHGLEFHYPAQLAGGPVAVWLETGWIHLFGPGLTGLRILNGLINNGMDPSFWPGLNRITHPQWINQPDLDSAVIPAGTPTPVWGKG